MSDDPLRPIFLGGRLIGYKNDRTGESVRIGTIATSPRVFRAPDGTLILRGGTQAVLDKHLEVLGETENGKESGGQEQDEEVVDTGGSEAARGLDQEGEGGGADASPVRTRTQGRQGAHRKASKARPNTK